MEMLRNGDMRGMESIYQRYKTALYSYFCGIIGQKEAAEDLVMSTMERLFTYRHAYKSDKNFRAWLFTMARNLAMDQYRHDRRRDNFEQEPHPEHTPDFDPSDAVDINSQLSELLKHLSEGDREIISLHYLAEVSYEDLSQILDLSVNALRIRVYRILKKLNKVYHLKANSNE